MLEPSRDCLIPLRHPRSIYLGLLWPLFWSVQRAKHGLCIPKGGHLGSRYMSLNWNLFTGTIINAAWWHIQVEHNGIWQKKYISWDYPKWQKLIDPKGLADVGWNRNYQHGKTQVRRVAYEDYLPYIQNGCLLKRWETIVSCLFVLFCLFVGLCVGLFALPRSFILNNVLLTR